MDSAVNAVAGLKYSKKIAKKKKIVTIHKIPVFTVVSHYSVLFAKCASGSELHVLDDSQLCEYIQNV